MEQNASGKFKRSSTSTEIRRILWKPKEHYGIQYHLPPVSILRQNNSIHASPFHLYKIHFNIILPSIPKSSKYSLSSGVSTKVCLNLSCLPYTGCHRRNGPNFDRVFLMLNYTDITQNTYIQSWTVTEIMAREVWNFDSCYTLTDCQIHIETGRNM